MKRTPTSIKRIEEVKKQSIEQIFEKVGESNSIEYLKFINSTNSIDQFKFNLLTDFNQYSNLLEDRIWILFRTKMNYPIYTSDHPANGHMHYNETSSGYEICLPLSPNYILSIVLRKDFSKLSSMNDNIFEMDKENIKFYNSLIFQNAERFILNYNCDFSFALKMNKKFTNVE